MKINQKYLLRILINRTLFKSLISFFSILFALLFSLQFLFIVWGHYFQISNENEINLNIFLLKSHWKFFFALSFTLFAYFLIHIVPCLSKVVVVLVFTIFYLLENVKQRSRKIKKKFAFKVSILLYKCKQNVGVIEILLYRYVHMYVFKMDLYRQEDICVYNTKWLFID